jgi:hypothetical protein
MPTKRFPVIGSTVRVKFAGEPQRDGGGEAHLLAMSYKQGGYSSYIKLAYDWANVLKITKAELVVETKDHTSHGVGTKDYSGITVLRCTEGITFPNAGNAEAVFTKGSYSALAVDQHTDIASIRSAEGSVKRIDVTDIVCFEAPTSVRRPNGKKCDGKGHKAWRIEMRKTSKVASPSVILASDKHQDAAAQPYVEVTYVANPPKGIVLQNGPQGSVVSPISEVYDFDYVPGVGTDTISTWTIQLFGEDPKKPGHPLGTPLWSQNGTATAAQKSSNNVTFPLTGYAKLATGKKYWWRVIVTNSSKVQTDWSPQLLFQISTQAPVLSSPTPTSKTYDTLTGVLFGASYLDPDKNALSALRYQFRSAVGDLIWDSDLLTPTEAEVAPTRATPPTPSTIARKYAGPGLAAGDYTWSMTAIDSFGAESLPVGGSFTTLTDAPPDTGLAVDLTGYNRQRRRTRIIIRKTNGTGRGPGTIVAVIEDASNIGASEFYNSGGEFFFTLPAVHPQVPAIEPRETHYALEQYRGQGWVEITAGLIVDFDARGDDIIFYGYDYLGIFGLLIDERFNPNSSADKKADLWSSTNAGGSGTKYSNRKISQIVADQLDRAIHATNSPLGFMTRATMPAMEETVTIFTTFRERGPFVAGLLDSHRAGSGKYTRLRVRKTAAGSYQFVVDENPGKVRPALRMEYGGLVQDFRILAFGSWGTAVHGVGMPLEGTETTYSVKPVPVPSGTPSDHFPKTYGSYPKAQIFDNVSDSNDLIRRTQQAARSLGKLGKRLSVGLRQDVLDVKDGWDITDSLPIHIDRGAVDTTRMGSGYWTVLGWSWQVKPDGFRNLSLTIQPRDDTTLPFADLIESKPIYTGNPDWFVGKGPPTQARLMFTGMIGKPPSTYIDSDTGEIYQLDMVALADWDPDTGDDPPYVNVTADPNYSGVVIANEQSGFITTIPDDEFLPALPDPKYPPGSVVSWQGALYVVGPGGDTWEQQGGVAGPPGPPGPPGPAGGVDTVAPPAPVFKATPTSDVTQQEDGTTVVRLSGLVGYATSPGLIDLDYFSIQSTREVVAGSFPVAPDWSYATEWTGVPVDASGVPDVSGAHDAHITQPNVLPGAVYYWRAYAVDKSGNRSTPSAVLEVTAGADTTGPSRPSSIVTTGGMSTIGVRWDPISDPDFAYTEVQWKLSTDSSWSALQTGGTLVVITGVQNSDPAAVPPVVVVYNVRLRNVDTSGNVLHQTGTDAGGLPIYAKPSPKATDPDVGWVTAPDAVPTALPGSALIWDSATIAQVFAGKINADWINAGTLKVGAGAPGQAVGIEVYNTAGKLVGRWTGGTLNPDGTANLDGLPNGIEIYDPANPKAKLRLTAAGLVVYNDLPNATQAVTITPQGIDAGSVTFGSARGGHNFVLNSSFEMGAFSAQVQTDSSWDVKADWDASRVGVDINMNATAAGTLTIGSAT